MCYAVFFRREAANPTKPVPRSNSDEGSGATLAVPLSSTRRAVGPPELNTAKSSVLIPATKPVEMVNGANPSKNWTGEVVNPVLIPLMRILVPSLSVDHPPVMTAEEGSNPVTSNVIR